MLRLLRVSLIAVTGLTASSCATSPDPAPYRTEVLTHAPADPGSEATALPELPVAQVAPVNSPARKIGSLQAQDQDLRTILQGVAENFGLGYDIDAEVQGRITTHLRGVTLDQALTELLRSGDYSYEIQNGVLRVGRARLESRIFQLDYLALNRIGTATTVIQRRLGATGGQAGGGLGGGLGGGIGGIGGVGGAAGALGGGGADVISSVTVADLWSEIRVALEGLVFDSLASNTPAAGPTQNAQGATAFSRVDPSGRLIINPIAGQILVSARPAKLAEVEAYLTTFEGSVHRQVSIEAKIVEVVLSSDFDFGIDWGAVQSIGDLDVRAGTQTASSGGVQLTLGAGGQQISAVLRALSRQGDVRVLSSPRISALNNQRAVINVSRDEVFFAVNRERVVNQTGNTVDFNTSIQPLQVSVGIVLDVLAQISADDVISMNIRPVVTDVIAEKEFEVGDGTRTTVPIIDRRETDTLARVRSGETIVIGGLMQTRQVETRSGVPVLRDIPLLGSIFTRINRRSEKRELVIFVTPTVVAGQLRAAGS